MATLGELNSGCLKGVGLFIEAKPIQKNPNRDFDYCLPKRGGRLIGGSLIGVGLYMASFSVFGGMPRQP